MRPIRLFNGIVFRAGFNFACHYLADRFAQQCRSMFGECLHDIALRQYADDTMIDTEDDERADASFGQ